MQRSVSVKAGGGGAEEKVTTLLSTSQIPIIDLAHMGTEECPVKSVVTRVAGQLKRAFEGKGMAILVNHGIPEEKLKAAWNYLDGFCDLPTDVKDVYLRKSGNNHGYVKPGLEKMVGKTEELRHAFNICTLSGATLPEEPLPGFKDLMADLSRDFKNLASLLLQALSVALEVPLDFFLEKHANMLSGNDDNETTLRLLYYPPLVEDDNTCELVQKNMSYSYQRCASHALQLDKIVMDDDEAVDEKDGKNGNGGDDWMKKHRGLTHCGAHCDYGTFTLLCQDAESGLEAKLPGSERWQRVGHLPGSILINTGELLSLWTNEKFRALPHRVVVPGQQQAAIKVKGRHSMAFFVHPDNETEIVPIDLQIQAEKEAPKKKKPFPNKIMTAYQHIQNKFKQSNPS